MPGALKRILFLPSVPVILMCFLMLPESGSGGSLLVSACNALQRQVARETYLQFGINASPARSIAQIQAESSCVATAHNRLGARGLGQFMPGTGRWIHRAYADQLSGMTPYSASWSIRAMVIYNRYHYDKLSSTLGQCARWAFTLAAYNSGEGGMLSARRRAGNANTWFGSAEHRAPQETRLYVNRILRQLEPAYISAGWPGRAVC